MFIDYHYDASDTEYLPNWLQLNGFPLTEKHAKNVIIKWIKNENFERRKWAKKMKSFVDYFAHRHPDFETYRQCVLHHIREVGAELTL